MQNCYVCPIKLKLISLLTQFCFFEPAHDIRIEHNFWFIAKLCSLWLLSQKLTL